MMRKLLTVFTVFLIFVTFSISSVMADGMTDNATAINDSDTASNNFQAFMVDRATDTSNAYYRDFVNQTKSTAQDLRRAAGEFTTVGLSGKEARAVESMKTETLAQAQDVENWGTAAAKNDLRGSDKAQIQFQNENDSFNTSYDDYTRARYLLTDNQYRLIYWAAFIVCAVIALIAGLWFVMRNYACNHKKSDKEIRQQAERKKLAWLSLTPLAGAAITLLTYYYAIGGTYVVMWGAIVIGAGVFIRALLQYRKTLAA